MKVLTMNWVLAIALCSGAAAAQPPGEPAPEAGRLAAGKKLLAEGKTKEACAEFEKGAEEAGSLELRFEIAGCREAEGKTATAYTEYFEIATAADTAPHKELGELASRRAEALKERLCKLSIATNAADLPGAAITDNGLPVPPSFWGRPVPVDPGAHDIVVKAPGHEDLRSRVEVGPAAGTVEVQLRFDIPAPPISTVTAVTATATASAAPIALPERALPPGRIAAVVLGAAGLVGLSAGLVFGVQAQTQRDAADKASGGGLAHCDAQNRCDAIGLGLRSEAKNAAIASTVGIVAGGAALAGGVVLWLLSGPPGAPKKAGASVAIGASLSPSGAGLSMGGRF